MMEIQSRAESVTDFADTPSGLASRWAMEIEASQKELLKFQEDGDRITRRYLDKRDEWAEQESRVNLFWSTTKVVMSLLYSRPPRADVARSFLDADDDTARVAGSMMQRLLNRSFDDNVSNWDAAVRQCIEDWIVVGMGQAWMRYEVETQIETVPAEIDPMTGMEIAPEQQVERIVNEDAPVDYIYWKDFFYSPARVWDEVRWVARRVYMTRDQLVARFGEEIGKSVPLFQRATNDANAQTPKNDPWSKAEVYEIWSKDDRKVYWYAKGAATILDVKDDPLQLDKFFPCPKPLVANVTSSNFIGRADFIFAQDQFEELDEINTRITWLTRAAKVTGLYDRNHDGVQRLFSQAAENQLIPVDNWAGFAEGGGIKGKVDFAPIETIVNAINQLRQYRQDKTVQIYEVLGVSDIMRGSSRATETATAQSIKAQFGSTRVQLNQFYIAEWVTNLLRIKSEIISKHWQPETIVQRSNIERTPDAQFAVPAVQLIKDEKMAEYRISIEADSMAAMDWAAERDSAVQFMQGLGAFVSQVGPMAQQVPGSAPYFLKLMQWAVSKFRVSSQIESVLDQAIAQLQNTPVGPQGPTPEQQADMASKMAQAKEREANAMDTQVDTQAKVMQLNQMRQNFQPNPQLPPIMR
jgi:hypothetical protein